MKTRISVLLVLLFAAVAVSHAAGDAVYCPVCGWTVDAKTAIERESGSSTVMLCSERCAACWDTHRKEMEKGMVLDPVCGMVFDSSKGVREIVDGRAVVFCSDMCRDSYVKSPKKYAKTCLAPCTGKDDCCAKDGAQAKDGCRAKEAGCDAGRKAGEPKAEKKAEAGCGGCAGDGCKHPS